MINLWTKMRGTSPFFFSCFQGLFYKFVFASTYAFFGQYLNVDGHQFAGMMVLMRNASSFKMFFSFLSESVPICGLRRLPYTFVAVCVIIGCTLTMFFLPMPEPYFDTVRTPDNCTRDISNITNPEAPNKAFIYIVLIILSTVCMQWADCCIDGLMIQKSMLEEDKKRGTLLVNLRVVGKIAGVAFSLFFALAFNKVVYGGSFCTFGLDFNEMSLVVSAFSVVTLVYVTLFTNEKDIDTKRCKFRTRKNLKRLWTFIKTSHFLKLVLYKFLVSILFGINTPARSKVEIRWVKVEPLVKQAQNIIVSLTSAFAMLIFKKYFMQANWRRVILNLTATDIVLRIITESLAIFGVVRNQYFWYADDIITGFFRTWVHFIFSLMIIEYVPKRLEGTSFAFLFSVHSCSASIGTAGGNIIMSMFDVTDDTRFLRDSTSDRLAVFFSYSIDWTCALCTLIFLFLIPTQKNMAKEWREKGGKSSHGKLALVLLVFITIGFVLSVVLSALTLFEETRCLAIAGGSGCPAERPQRRGTSV